MKDQVGVYLPPQAIVSNPEYAQRLVERGVNLFVLRAGFDPQNLNPALGAAIEIARKLGVRICLLVGTWWGHAEKEIPLKYGKSFESKFPSHNPGGDTDFIIWQTLSSLCAEYKVEEICLTHARFRHPAYIEGVFEVGDEQYQESIRAAGINPEEIKKIVPSLSKQIHSMRAADLWELAEHGLEVFIGRLTEPELVEHWFDFRCDRIFRSVSSFASVVHNSGKQFGTNAFSPIAARLCGQDYLRLSKVCDEIQPLLGYMEWHTLESISAWAKFLLVNAAGLSSREAIAISKRLFYLENALLPEDIYEIDHMGEGGNQAVLSVTKQELNLTAQWLRQNIPLTPVLRGKTWSKETTDQLVKETEMHGFRGIIFQGCSYLAPPIPDPIWD